MPLFHLARRLPERRRRLLTKAAPAAVGKQLVQRRRQPVVLRRAVIQPQLRRYWTGTITRRMTERRVAPIAVPRVHVFPRWRRHISAPDTSVPGFQLVKQRRLPTAEHSYPPLRRAYRRLPLTKFGKVAPQRLILVVTVQRWVPRRGRFIPLIAAKYHPRRRLYPLAVPPAAVYPRGRRMLLIAVKLMPLGRLRRFQTLTIPPPFPERRQRLFAMLGRGLVFARSRPLAERRVCPALTRPRQPLTATKLFVGVRRGLAQPTATQQTSFVLPRRRHPSTAAKSLPPRTRPAFWLPTLDPKSQQRRRFSLTFAKWFFFSHREPVAQQPRAADVRRRRLLPLGNEALIVRTGGGVVCVCAQGIYLLAPAASGFYLLGPVEQGAWIMAPVQQGINCEC